MPVRLNYDVQEPTAQRARGACYTVTTLARRAIDGIYSLYYQINISIAKIGKWSRTKLRNDNLFVIDLY